MKLNNNQQVFFALVRAGLWEQDIRLSKYGQFNFNEIYRLAELKKQLTLSISLHAAFPEKRSSIMPVNLRYPMDDLMRACRDYVKTTGRRVSFEYTVIHGFNDGDEDAEKLASLVRGFQTHVNVIPVNEAGRGDFSATRKQATTASQPSL